MRKMWLAFLLLFAVVVTAQDKPEKIRVFVTDSQSWESVGAMGFSGGTGGGASSGGARPQNAEIAKTFKEKCPGPTVTIDRSKADYILTLDHEGGKGVIRKDNKWALYTSEGDLIDAGSTRSLGNAVKDACKVIEKEGTVDPRK